MAMCRSKQSGDRGMWIPEEVLIEILKRLSPKPLFRFMSVAKRFKSILSDPIFIQNYRGLKQGVGGGMLYPYEYCRKHFDDIRYGCTRAVDHHHNNLLFLYLSSSKIYSQSTRFLSSSNGLILSQPQPDSYPTIILRVSNPLTKQAVYLPPVKMDKTGRRLTCGFSSKFACFRVVLIRSKPNRNISKISIFSSNTRRWERVRLVTTYPLPLPQSELPITELHITANSFCHKGILHWSDKASRSIVTYDPFDSPDRFGSICLPEAPAGEVLASMNVARFYYEDEDDSSSIEWCEIERRGIDTSLAVWRSLEDGKWRLKQRFQISPLPILTMMDCTLVIANSTSYCYLFATGGGKRITTIDLITGKQTDMDIPTSVIGQSRMDMDLDRPLLPPLVFNPWSSLKSSGMLP